MIKNAVAALAAAILVLALMPLGQANLVSETTPDVALEQASKYFNDIGYGNSDDAEQAEVIAILYLLVYDIKLHERQVEQNQQIIELLSNINESNSHIAEQHT